MRRKHLRRQIDALQTEVWNATIELRDEREARHLAELRAERMSGECAVYRRWTQPTPFDHPTGLYQPPRAAARAGDEFIIGGLR